MLDFIVMRLEKDGELIRDLAGCRNWPDALAVQSRWVQEMMRDYMEEAPKLLAFSITTERQGRTVGRGR
jgi:hypothetical protein